MAGPTPVDRLLSALSSERGKELRVGLVGDIHGQHKRPALDIFCREAVPDILLQVGDLQDYRGGYPIPMLFIRGNHECWAVLDAMDAGQHLPVNLAHLPDLHYIGLSGARVVGLGGCWSSSGKGLRKHITEEQIARLRKMSADIVLSHETPIRFGNSGASGSEANSASANVNAGARNRGQARAGQHDRFAREYRDRGLAVLREACIAMRPRIWASGHHHHFETEQLGRTTIVSLGKWPDEWATFEIGRRGQISDPVRFVPQTAEYSALKAFGRAREAEEKELLFRTDRQGGRYGTDDGESPQLPRA